MNQRSRIVLIVDDSPEDRELYRRYLLSDRDYTYTFLEASSGQQGLALWRQHQPDAMLLDYRLPDLNGLEFLAQLRPATQQQPTTQQFCLPIIVVTGQGNEAIAVQAMKAGAQDYLIKGEITPEKLHLAINGAIETAQIRTRLQQQLEQQRLVMQITQRIRQSLDLPEILQTTVDEVRQVLQVDRVIIFRFFPDWHGRVVVESCEASWTAILSTEIYDPCFGKNYIEPFRQGGFTAKADIQTAGISDCHLELLSRFQVRANLVMPILQGNELWGLLIAHHCAAPRQWHEAEIDLLRQIAAQVGIALQQSSLLAQVQTELNERKQAEKQLQNLSDRLTLAVRSGAIGIWDWDISPNILTWDDRMYELYGITPDCFTSVYDAWASRLHPDDLPMAEAALQLALLGQKEYDVEFRVVYPDGTIRFIKAYAHLQRDAQGEPQYLVGINFDITERKQAEIALRSFNTELEQRVAERTAELTAINDRLLSVLKEQAQTEAALQQQTRQEQLRWNVTQAIRQSLDLDAVLNTAVAEVRQTLRVDRVAVYRFQPDWSGDFIAESVGSGWINLVNPKVQKVWEDTHLQDTQGGRFRNYETFVISDIYAAGLHSCHIDLLEQFQAKAYTVAPIFSGTTLWGLLAIYQNATPRHWQDWEVELLQQIASQLSIAIQQSELYRQLQVELTERLQATATIREAERRWRSLLENVQLIVVGLDQTGIVNYVNPFFLSLTGYSDSEVIGKNWFENFLPPASQPSTQLVFSEVLTQDAHPHHQNVILTKAGEERLIAWNNTLLQSSDGAAIGSISIGEDITERQKMEKMKNEFISLVSHELRTPLTSIRGSLGLLATGMMDDEPDQMKRMIDIAAIDTERLVRLVNDVLDLEKLESGKVSFVREWCNVTDLMQRSLEVMQSSAQAAGVQLVVQPFAVQIWTAPDRIIQTFTNLLSNAIKFSPSGSTVTLAAEVRPSDPEYILFSVQDQGRGIPADKLESIFGRFQQADASDPRDRGGTGLGLAICKSIVEQNNGQIWAESRWEQGSTFFFTLPLQTR
ncbi:MAG: GAF domain-containing protein [Oscillatoriophycideae cyanobacterium NC_groundwater_1537_Pr4_S-0.65um_50_18]|nr:GAF domain-containing protein [Oscillatoriophycideae cyanobacterium NC_groundwater_1537_Pr4_S-0.65um_50_18]